MSDIQTKELLEDALLLVEQNFYFLHAGAFFDKLSREHDLSALHQTPVYKQLDDGTLYLYNQTIISELMSDASKKSPNEPTLFGYFVELNAIRGICMATIEAAKLDSPFKTYLQNKLRQQYEDFIDVVSFVRNVLSHNIHAEIRLSELDFKGTRERIVRMRRNTDIAIDIDYQHILPEIKTPKNGYGFQCHINFADLKPNDEFLEILSQTELFKLAELCYNFVYGYKL